MAGIWLFTDTHFGARSNSQEWFDIILSAHNDFIIPTIKNNWKNGDLIIMCGDVYDNRQSINLKVLDAVIKVYENLAKLGQVHIIAGNHDIYKKDSTEITSLDSLKWIDGINIWKNPACINVKQHKLFLMPWRANVKEEGETLKAYQKQYKPDYAFMHGTFSGSKYNKYVKIEKNEGGSLSSTVGYKKVFSGHIHWQQDIKNVNIMGSPYELTRGDADNKKGIYYLDLDSGEETFYENTISPKHIKFTINEFKEEFFDDIIKASPNNFVDVHVSNTVFSKYASKLTAKFKEITKIAKDLKVHSFEDFTDEEDVDEVKENIDYQELIFSEVKKKLTYETDRSRAIKIINDIIKEVS